MSQGTGKVTLILSVNGKRHRVQVPAHWTLLRLLRDELELTGTKECCAVGECGACTVLMNGLAVNACLVLAAEADGSEVVTIEDFRSEGLRRLQEAFVAEGAVQCGFCLSGMIMAAHALLLVNPRPTKVEVEEGLAGNLCRCGGYTRIVRAVLAVSRAAL